MIKNITNVKENPELPDELKELYDNEVDPNAFNNSKLELKEDNNDISDNLNLTDDAKVMANQPKRKNTI